MSYMTEAQARKRWCPMVRISPAAVPAGAAHGGAVNVVQADGKPSRLTAATACIASQCMMWRNTVIDVIDDDAPLPSSISHGYCGLAGRPLDADD